MIKFIVKFAPEMTIKTRPVRKRFAARLAANIQKVMSRHELAIELVKGWDMLEIVLKDGGQRCAELLADIPGISHFLEVIECELPDSATDADAKPEAALAFIAERVDAETGGALAGQSFVVRCKRSGTHPFTSHDVEKYVGAHLLRETKAAKVQLKGADITVALEIKRGRLFIVRRRHPGRGGYPLGAVSPVLSLVSGGYDSSVASYETIRRGMETHFLFFNLGGHAHEVGVKQVSYYLWERYASSHRTAFVSVPFDAVVGEILDKVANPYMGVVLKRMMMRAASQIAREMNIPALVTGESVAQVSSQTIQNLAVIDEVAEVFTLRPLATMDKTDIMARAAAIGVAEFAEHMPEYCAVISDKPTTAAKLERVAEEEAKFDFEILNAAVVGRTPCAIDSVYRGERLYDDIEQQSVPQPGEVIIDLRTEDEREKRPLQLHGNESLCIPFYRINQQFAELDSSRQYLLYCDRGVMSRLHAAHLKAEGFDNIKVYQPATQGATG